MEKFINLIKKLLKLVGKLIYNNKGFIIILVAILGIRFYFISVDIVVGTSMVPTLQNDDVVIVDTKLYKLSELDRFDVIVFDLDESEKERFLVKRVIGLPGETVEMKDNKLYVDGKLIEVDDYLDEFNQVTFDFNSGKIPEGHYFVLGDNRPVSLDSRDSEAVGFVSEESIHGRVFFRQKPFSEFGFIK